MNKALKSSVPMSIMLGTSMIDDKVTQEFIDWWSPIAKEVYVKFDETMNKIKEEVNDAST